MARPNYSAELRKIQSIREVQLAAAEARAAQSAESVRKKTAIQVEREKACQEVEELWLSSLSARLIPTEMLPSLRMAYLCEEEVLRNATRIVKQANTELTLHKDRLHEITAHRDVAKRMARRALRQQEKKREEMAALDASDRHAQMAGKP